MSSRWRKPDQIIEPWQFGHEASKKTCLWLKNLPFLVPTNVVGKGEVYVSKSGNKSPKCSLTYSSRVYRLKKEEN